ncbi:BTB/POZ domain-containing protein At3g08570 [Cucurbita moschata]|uniref:BTB/POZ domain-containing protein At3g08570 n=1 Tax=Cucurbita moschata TaxID=3662 RepID=A0A6J1F3H4_CUCMO|nr:BTB/POZ domain-containing protein At3g08570 [Cucurbita moschata]
MVLMSEASINASSTPKLGNSTTRIFSDVAGDITIAVHGESFLLHKFPLVARSGKIRKMVGDGKGCSATKFELLNLPGGPQAFELAVKFCYGMNFEITTANVAHLRCVGEYLEMTEEYREENLIARTEMYLNEIVIHSLEKSVQVLVSCEGLSPVAEQVGITDACVEGIAMNACKEQLVSGLSRLDYVGDSPDLKCPTLEWWIEDLSSLQIDFYERVICAMARKGIRPDSIVASLMHYAQASLEGTSKSQFWNPSRPKLSPLALQNHQITIVETLVSLMPTDKSCIIPLSFLFGMLRMAIMMDTNIACRLELERRIAFRLEMVSLDDLLIPSTRVGDMLFDVDTVHRMLVNFLQRVEEEENEDCGYDSDQDLASPNHGCLLKVGRLIDAYLAEIAPDPYLSLHKFVAMIEILPDYARVIDDGLYRAVDIYLKAHPKLTEEECKRVCHLIDCEKLSQEASNHAAKNDRLPVHMTVRVLYFEQLRLKNSISVNVGDGFMSQRMSSGVGSAAMSPRDNYASLRRENRELKLEISRMRVRLSELEKEQSFMKEGMMSKSGNGTTFLTSLSKGIGRIGIFSSTPGEAKRRKAARRSRGSGKKCIQTQSAID